VGRTWSRAGRGAQRKARETRKCSQTRQNQPGKARAPRGPCFFSGYRSTINRSFAGLIRNNTPPALGNNDSWKLNLVPRKTHFCGRPSNGDSCVTETRTRQPQSVSATRLPFETSSNTPISVYHLAGTLHSPARSGTVFQPCSSTTANVLVHVRSLLNPRQEKKRQNHYNWHRRRNGCAGIVERPRIIGHAPEGRKAGLGRARTCQPALGKPRNGRRKFAENSLCTREKRIIIKALELCLCGSAGL
jgi:hypothetical protein